MGGRRGDGGEERGGEGRSGKREGGEEHRQEGEGGGGVREAGKERGVEMVKGYSSAVAICGSASVRAALPLTPNPTLQTR